MKNILLITIISLFFVGCGGPKTQILKDGNIYYPDYSKYDNCTPHNGYAKCSKNGVYVETIYPLSSSQLEYIRYEEQKRREMWSAIADGFDKVGESYRSNANSYRTPLPRLPTTTRTNCSSDFFGSYNCTSSTY